MYRPCTHALCSKRRYIISQELTSPGWLAGWLAGVDCPDAALAFDRAQELCRDVSSGRQIPNAEEEEEDIV